MESTIASPVQQQQLPLPRPETMKEYVIRRAAEVKRYGWVSGQTGVNRHWLSKLAIGKIPKPNYDDIQTLHDFYKSLEQQPA